MAMKIGQFIIAAVMGIAASFVLFAAGDRSGYYRGLQAGAEHEAHAEAQMRAQMEQPWHPDCPVGAEAPNAPCVDRGVWLVTP